MESSYKLNDEIIERRARYPGQQNDNSLHDEITFDEQTRQQKEAAEQYLYAEDLIEAISRQRKSLKIPLIIITLFACIVLLATLFFQMFIKQNSEPAVLLTKGKYLENIEEKTEEKIKPFKQSLIDKVIEDKKIDTQKDVNQKLAIREILIDYEIEKNTPMVKNQPLEKTGNNIIENNPSVDIDFTITVPKPEPLSPKKEDLPLIEKLLSSKIAATKLTDSEAKQNDVQKINYKNIDENSLEIKKQVEQNKIVPTNLRPKIDAQNNNQISNLIANIKPQKLTESGQTKKILQEKNKKNQIISIEKGFYIQLAALRTMKEADEAINKLKLKQANSGLLKSYGYQVVLKTLKNQGVFHTIRIGNFDKKNKADQLCQKIKQQGLSDCFVSN